MSHVKHQDTSRISAATADRDGVLLSMEIGHPEDSCSMEEGRSLFGGNRSLFGGNMSP